MVAQLRPADPATVGPYRLLGRLGAGGMGQVFLARSPGGRLVAVKVIRPELADETGFRTRFAREVAAARNVSGIFTALVVDADTDGPVPWLATAYVPGPSLTELVHEQGPLPPGAVLTLAAGLAEGLGAIHAAGVVHRDLKPSNVLLAHDGPRVIDFGISRALEATMMTTTGMVMGSPGFMSPEQARGETVGPPSDVFSLGAVLAYAATGEGPFGAGPTPALLYRVVNEPPRLQALPPEVRPVVEQCLAKDPAARPTSQQLLAQLGGVDLSTDWLPAQHTHALQQYAAPVSTPVSGERQQAPPTSTPQSAPPSMARPDPRAVATDIVSPAPGRPFPGGPVGPVPGGPVPGSPVPGSPVPGGPVPGGAARGSQVPDSPVPGGVVPAPPDPPRPRSRKRVILSVAALAAAAIVAVVVIFTLNSPGTFNGNVKIADFNGAQAVACGTPASAPPGGGVVITLVNNSPAPITATGLGNGSVISVPAHDTKQVGALSNAIWRVSGQQQECVSDFKILADSRIVIAAA
jgi:serine/threonine protein kinase